MNPINLLFKLYKEEKTANVLKKIEEELYKSAIVLVRFELKKKTRNFYLTYSDREDILQESYLTFREVLEKNTNNFAKEFMKRIRRKIHKINYYKKKERLMGEIPANFCSVPNFEMKNDYNSTILKISKSANEAYILKNILNNRLLEKNYTLEQIALFCSTNMYVISTLEKKLKREIAKEEEDV